MSDWKEKIEAQFVVTDARGDYINQHSSVDSNMHYDSAETMRLLLDVAVAAELLTDSLRVVEEHDDRNLSNATKLARQNDALMRLRVALDKLREASDE